MNSQESPKTAFLSVEDFDFDFDFNILTALKGWVGHAPQGRGALQNHRHCALLNYRTTIFK